MLRVRDLKAKKETTTSWSGGFTQASSLTEAELASCPQVPRIDFGN